MTGRPAIEFRPAAVDRGPGGEYISGGQPFTQFAKIERHDLPVTTVVRATGPAGDKWFPVARA